MATALAQQDKAKKARELATTMASEKATTQERIRAAHGLIDIYTPELVRSLPAGVDGPRCVELARQHLREKPELLECTPDSLMSSLSRAMLGGFELGGPRADAYIVPFNTKLKLPGGKEVWRKLATCIESWRGLVKLVANTGRMTRQPLVRAIYDGESYDVRIVDYEKQVEHVLDVNNPGRRGDDDSKIVAFYAVFWIDGKSIVHFMPRAEVDAIRDKHSKAKDANRDVWYTHAKEMGFKTVIRQMIARGMVPVSYDQAEKMRRAQAVEVIEDASANSQVIDAQTWSVMSQEEPPTSDEHPTIPAVGHDAGTESDGQMGDRQ